MSIFADGRAWVCTGLGCLCAGLAWANGPDVAVQGFASLGHVISKGNNFYGHTTRPGGDARYLETGVNAYAQLSPDVSAAAQLISRRAGQTERGTVLVDYAFVDVRLPDTEGGVRLGRVKNPLGLFNVSRDVLSTRPSILMPQSVYLEGTGVRELMFSGDGAQFYQNWRSDSGYTQLSLNWMSRRQGSAQMERNFAASDPTVDTVRLSIDRPVIVALDHESTDGRQRYAVAYANFPVVGSFRRAGAAYGYGIDSRHWFFSFRHNDEHFSLTSEWRVATESTQIDGQGAYKFKPRGGYVQLDYRFDPAWTGYTRFDWHNASNNTGKTGHDTVLGVAWRLGRGWQANVEYHRMIGRLMVPAADNPGQPQERTHLLAFMLGHRF